MVSRESKVQSSKFLMLFAFLGIITILIPMPFPNPVLVASATVVEFLDIRGVLTVPVAALFMFGVFLLGVEMYLRNRKHWNEL